MEKPNPTFLQLLPAWQEETSVTRRTITRCGREASGLPLAHLIDNYRLFQSCQPGQKQPAVPPQAEPNQPNQPKRHVRPINGGERERATTLGGWE